MKYRIKIPELVIEADSEGEALFKFTEKVRKSVDPSLGGTIEAYAENTFEYNFDHIELNTETSVIQGWVDASNGQIGISLKEPNKERQSKVDMVVLTPLDDVQKKSTYINVEAYTDYTNIGSTNIFFNETEALEALSNIPDIPIGYSYSLEDIEKELDEKGED